MLKLNKVYIQFIKHQIYILYIIFLRSNENVELKGRGGGGFTNIKTFIIFLEEYTTSIKKINAITVKAVKDNRKEVNQKKSLETGTVYMEDGFFSQLY